VSDDRGPSLTPAELIHDHARILKALRRAVREALLSHKRAGNPVAVWQDGRVVWVPAEDIPIDIDDPIDE
jgi:hypothetical protein